MLCGSAINDEIHDVDDDPMKFKFECECASGDDVDDVDDHPMGNKRDAEVQSMMTLMLMRIR